MLLAIDIGNSATKFGVFDGQRRVSQFSIPTVRTHTANELNLQIADVFPAVFSSIVVSSVVPELNAAYRIYGEKFHDTETLIVGSDFDFGLKLKYDAPEKLGVDRLIAAFAAIEKYGKPCIVCDFGTATTIDAVNSQGEFLGGVIVAGMRLLADALFHKTSKLPPVEIIKPAKIIGDSTVKAIQAGTYFGYVGLADGIIKRMIVELGESPRVVATGGFAKIIGENSEYIETVDENLMLEGLLAINQRRLSPKS